eukprot:6443579-Amphidinium_carterae.3
MVKRQRSGDKRDSWFAGSEASERVDNADSNTAEAQQVLVHTLLHWRQKGELTSTQVCSICQLCRDCGLSGDDITSLALAPSKTKNTSNAQRKVDTYMAKRKHSDPLPVVSLKLPSFAKKNRWRKESMDQKLDGRIPREVPLLPPHAIDPRHAQSRCSIRDANRDGESEVGKATTKIVL